MKGLDREKLADIFLIVVVAALLAAFLQVTLGGIVRVTGSGLGCPDWPLCHGRLVPPLEYTALIEYFHRLTASILGVLVFISAMLSLVLHRKNKWMLISNLSGLALVIMAAVLGGITVMTELDTWARLVHLGLAEGVVACLLIASVMGLKSVRKLSNIETTIKNTIKIKVLTMSSLLGMFIVILFGSYMVGYGAGSACSSWPLCKGSLIPDGVPYAIHMGHRFTAAVIGILIAMTTWATWSQRAKQKWIGTASVALAVLFIAQIFIGAVIVWIGFDASIKSIHLSLATLVWMSLAFLAYLVYSPIDSQLSGGDNYSEDDLDLRPQNNLAV